MDLAEWLRVVEARRVALGRERGSVRAIHGAMAKSSPNLEETQLLAEDLGDRREWSSIMPSERTLDRRLRGRIRPASRLEVYVLLRYGLQVTVPEDIDEALVFAGFDPIFRSRHVHAASEVLHMSAQMALRQDGVVHRPTGDWLSPAPRNRWRFKLVAFDFDGTLLRGRDFEFSWEAVWNHLGYPREIQSQHKREYRQRSANASRADRITAYQDWCDNACAAFKARGLTRDMLRELSKQLHLTRNCHKALGLLRKEGFVTAIISGGINTFLEDKFPDYREHVDFVFINELGFTASGALDGVRATSFDFEGKAEALELICDSVGCTYKDVVFVGDHFNDEAIMLKAGKIIAYPPRDAIVEREYHAAIAEDDLLRLIPHVLIK